jgi:hypothetical protein
MDILFCTAWLRAAYVLELLNWIPSPETITAIQISTTKHCHPNTCKEIVKKLVELKTPPKQSKNTVRKPPPLTKLAISGPKVTPAVLEAILKTSLVGPHLTTLVLTNDVQVSKLVEVVLRLLEACSNLSQLTLPGMMIYYASIPLQLARLCEARGGNSTLLRLLDL